MQRKVLAALILLAALAVLWTIVKRPEVRPREDPGWIVEVPSREFHIGEQSVYVTVRDRSGDPLRGPLVTVSISKEGSLARTYGGFMQSEGVFMSPVRFTEPGFWDIKVYVFLEGRSKTFEKRIFVSQTARP